MRKHGVSKDLSNMVNFFKYFTKFKFRFLRLELPLFSLIALIILLTGAINSFLEFPIKDVNTEDILNFPKAEDYMNAGSYYKDGEKFLLVDMNQEVNSIYPDLLNIYSKSSNLDEVKDYIKSSISTKFKNKNVIIRRIDNIKLTDTNISLHSAKLENMKDKIDSLKSEMREMSLFTRKRYEKTVKKLTNAVTSVERLNGYILELSVLPVVHYDKLNDTQSFKFVAGKLISINFSGTKYIYKLLNPKPVIANSFFNNSNLSLTANEADVSVFNSIKVRFEKKKSDLIDQKYSAEILKTKDLRKEYRKTFFGKLFGKFFFYLTNYFALILYLTTIFAVLKHIKSIGKLDDNNYFASEITVLALKILSIILLTIGVLIAAGSTYIFIFSSIKYNDSFKILWFRDILYLFPLFTMIKLYLMMWGLLLGSELMRFVTNIYHLTHSKIKLNGVVIEESKKSEAVDNH